MRSFEQRKEEIFARGKEKIARRKKNTKMVLMTCVPLFLCVCIAGGYLALGNGGQKLAMDAAAPENGMVMDSMAEGDANYGHIYDGANVPDSEFNRWDGDLHMYTPGASAPEVDSTMCLELSRDGRYFNYTEPEIVDMFLGILETQTVGSSQIDATDGDHTPVSEPDPGKLIEDKPYPVKLTYPDGEEVSFILRGQLLTGQDGQQYMLTQEQASILHKLLEVVWP